jgi:antitoxin component YwqK of YwqJK toxin-antitoxin module
MTNELKRPEVIRKKDSELNMVGNGVYTGEEYWYEGKPFNGFVVFDYYENGNILLEIEHANGQTMGWHVEYYENGKIKYERLNYGDSTVVFRYFDEEGNKTREYWPDRESYNEVAKETGMVPLED